MQLQGVIQRLRLHISTSILGSIRDSERNVSWKQSPYYGLKTAYYLPLSDFTLVGL